jgi:NAD(P)-dependent dehydrogenase (short-subunit alcohol dehydrogenase family)
MNVLLCARDVNLLEVNTLQINQRHGNAQYVACDVTKPGDLENAVQLGVSSFGTIDFGILNAGIGKRVVFSDFDRNAYETVILTNLHGVVNGIVALTSVMKQQGFGTIVGISSLADVRPFPGNSAYIASKAALGVMLEAAAIDLKPFGIRVLTVRPGFIRTDMTAENKMRMPMLMDPERAAAIIVDGMLKNRSRLSFPWPVAILSALTRFIPSSLWRYKFSQR